MRITQPSQVTEDRIHLEKLGLQITQWGGGAGAALLAVSYIVSLFLGGESLKHFYFSYLTNYCFYLSLSLGALFFVALQHLTRSGWSVVVRRLAEIMAANIPLFVILFIPIVFGLGQLYQWAQPDVVAQDHLLQWKRPYLNITFFLFRCALYFACWWGLSRYFLNRSIEQDVSGEAALTLKMEWLSAPAIILFSVTISFAAIDFIMSLHPYWYSTIFGVYFFAGSLLGFFALLTIISFFLQHQGCLVDLIRVDHYHDLGKFLLSFVIFWAYIAFSQYMLIWYANIPEETVWFYQRQNGQWVWVALILVFGHFVIPFLGLLSRYPKRCKYLLTVWAAWILIMHWIDIYWMIMPEYNLDSSQIPLHWIDFFCLVGMGGLFVAGLSRIARGRSLVPLKDPRLQESLTFENA